MLGFNKRWRGNKTEGEPGSNLHTALDYGKH